MDTTVSRKTKVADIITARKPLLEEIRSRREALRETSTAIKMLEGQLHQILLDGSPSMKESLNGIDLEALQTKIDDEYRKLEKPESRFKRSTLNIGVLGRTGQGKSTLLRSLSKLGADVIPTGDKGFCTGARSLIIHDDNPQNAGADITFYSEGEFLNEVVMPYYKTLKLTMNPPEDFASFERQQLLPGLGDNIPLDGDLPTDRGSLGEMYRRGHTMLGQIYGHLLDYQKNIRAYKNLVGQPSRHISIAEVRNFVAQDDLEGNPLYNHLAVKEAVIRHRFGDLDVEQVGLLDMPGLGDMRIADEQHLVKALEEHIDIILFLIKPDPDRVAFLDVDFGLYDLAHATFEGLALKESSFIIINHRKSKDRKADNGENCERLRKEIKEGQRGSEGRRVEVYDSYIADCSNPDEARREVLDHVLDYLVNNMSQLDKTYISYWDKRRASLKTEIERVLSKVNHLADTGISIVDDEDMYKEHFHQIWQVLTTALEELLKKLRAKSHESNEIFANYFNNKFETCRNDTGLPKTKENIERLREARGSYLKVFIESLDHARTQLTHHFVDMDKKLQIPMDGIKREVADIFLRNGQLENLFRGMPSEHFFNSMLQPGNSIHARLCETLSVFNDYQLSLRGYFQSIIRNGGILNNLMPDNAVTKYLLPTYTATRLNRLRQQLPKLDQGITEMVTGIVSTFLTQVSSSSGTGSLSALLDGLLQNIPNLDMKTKELLAKLMKGQFLDESQQRIAEYEPEEILQALINAHKDTVDVMQKRLESLFSEPGLAALASVEEFVDQAFRSRYAEDDWDTFYRAHKPTIWSVEFGRTLKWQAYQRQWQDQVQKVREAASHL